MKVNEYLQSRKNINATALNGPLASRAVDRLHFFH